MRLGIFPEFLRNEFPPSARWKQCDSLGCDSRNRGNFGPLKKKGDIFSWRDVEIDQAISKQQRSRSYKLTSLFYLPIINPMLQCSSIFTSVKFPFHTQLRPRVEWSSAHYQMEEFSGVGEVTEFQASPEFTKQFVKYELKWQWYFSLKHKLCKKEGEKEAFVTQHRLQPKGLQNFNVILAIVLH